MLRRALPRHYLQHYDAAQDPVLHRKPDHSVHGHLIPDGARVLSAVGFRREGVAVHFDSTFADRVLPTVGGDHSSHIAGRSAARQVRALHHDPRHLQVN